MASSKEQTPRLFLTYMLGYLILMEWLIPLPEVTQTGYVTVFMVASAFFFLVMFLQFSWWICLLLFTGGILFGIHTIFFDVPFLGTEWWSVLFTDLSQNVQYMLNGEWYGLSDLFRSLLFLVLLGIMSYLIFFWIIHARRITFFFVFTVIYIAVMDTFLPYNGGFAMVRVFLLGFILMALLHWDRLSIHFSGVKKQKFTWIKWTFLSIFILVIAAGIGMMMPKPEPQWQDPVPFIESATGIDRDGNNAEDRVRKIGYGDNDERLGGGFEMDETPVLTARGEDAGYWRGESKNVYTGLGWESDTPEESSNQSDFFEDSVQTEEIDIDVEIADDRNFAFAFYPGSLQSLEAEEDIELQVDRYSGKASMFEESDAYEANAYTLTYENPEFPIEKMQDDSLEDPEEIEEHYLSLPDDLPSSIGELAEGLTEGEHNRYDKVRAVESYLNGPDFTYDTSNIAVPEEGEDYVEQFLFETQRGYCDNFSTSMAVMLRTLDIPVRWVKGFTKGEEVDRNGEEQVYEVTSANAHSWVEVYFPEVGWVPFEPTKGFGSEFDYTYNEENNDETDEEMEAETEEEEEEEEEESEEEQEEEEEDNTDAAGFNFPMWPIFLGAVFIVLGTLYGLRFTLIKKGMIYRFRHLQDSHSFTKAFHSLLTFLRYAGAGREDGETLREYGERIDYLFETEDMSYLVQEYERLHYGQRDSTNWSESLTAWTNLVNRIKA
ncbi:hypothetical protein J2S78_002917 [Salibacterium salarium]|uniref:transglutaminase TgpA family protein n=1 Tax=Salibacterium salarium TaxID=284579 RepID=UPI0027859F9B|nr:transglutaminaseTgpA domain-containing protein [Salibacterium salarium]MDQ0300449.1 hypothetical protein [Salibacterium salarium]